MSRAWTSLAVLALLAAPLARAQEKKELRAPLDPFAAAKKGDWEVIVMHAVTENAPGTARKAALVYRVAATSEDGVQLTLEPLPAPKGGGAPPLLLLKRGEKPLLSDILGVKDENVTGVTVTDDKRTVGGREFACRKIAFSSRKVIKMKASDDLVFTTRMAIWFSADVKGTGIVAAEREDEAAGGGVADDETHTRFEVAGFGNGEKAEWGKAPAELDLGPEPVPSPEKTKLPLNPFAKAKTGDWEAILQVVRSADARMPEQRIVHTITVTKATPEGVTYTAELRTAAGKRKLEASYSFAEPLTLEAFANAPAGEIRDVTVEDAKLSVGETSFDCKKIGYVQRHAFESKLGDRAVLSVNKTRTTLWLSEDMPGRGFVRSETKARGTGSLSGAIEMTMTLEVVGYGHGDVVTWGKRGDEIELPAPARPDGAPK